MKDRDQHLLWEAYVSEKDHTVAGRTPPKDKLNKGDFLPKKVRDKINKEEDETPYNGDDEDDGKKDEPVEEDMSNMEFSAIGRENPEQMVFDAVLSWMRADTEGLTTPEDMEGYNMNTAFDDAKDFIKSALQDISFSEVKSHLNNTVDLRDDEGLGLEEDAY